jgi:hypothetical protein
MVYIRKGRVRNTDANPPGHIDPFELLIDAGICDRRCEPLE